MNCKRDTRCLFVCGWCYCIRDNSVRITVYYFHCRSSGSLALNASSCRGCRSRQITCSGTRDSRFALIELSRVGYSPLYVFICGINTSSDDDHSRSARYSRTVYAIASVACFRERRADLTNTKNIGFLYSQCGGG